MKKKPQKKLSDFEDFHRLVINHRRNIRRFKKHERLIKEYENTNPDNKVVSKIG